MKLKEQEDDENKRMKIEEDRIKKMICNNEYKTCVDYIKDETRAYILLEFIFLQYQ